MVHDWAVNQVICWVENLNPPKLWMTKYIYVYSIEPELNGAASLNDKAILNQRVEF